jgi:hypothetical protein
MMEQAYGKSVHQLFRKAKNISANSALTLALKNGSIAAHVTQLFSFLEHLSHYPKVVGVRPAYVKANYAMSFS